ncbi:MAG: hypothetical protein U0S48_06925 [Solirubrobacteraceae bacterium]
MRNEAIYEVLAGVLAWLNLGDLRAQLAAAHTGERGLAAGAALQHRRRRWG